MRYAFFRSIRIKLLFPAIITFLSAFVIIICFGLDRNKHERTNTRDNILKFSQAMLCEQQYLQDMSRQSVVIQAGLPQAENQNTPAGTNLFIKVFLICCAGNIINTGRLDKLLDACKKVKEGDLAARIVEDQMKDELSQAFKTFNEMAEALEYRNSLHLQTEDILSKNENKYRSFFENALEGIFQSAPEGSLISVNPAMARICGFATPEEMITTIADMDRQLFVDDENLEEYTHLLKEKGVVKGFETQFYKKDGDISWVSMNVRTIKNEEGRIIRHDGIIEDITRYKLAEDSFKQNTDRLRRTLASTINIISLAVEIRDPYTAGHQRRVSSLSRTLAQEMGLPKDMVENIRIAGSTHDIGKISIPAEILNKPGKLNDKEIEIIKTHAQAGYDILKNVGLPHPVAEIVIQHHERINGTGYPKGLMGNQILIEARILAVADALETIISHRSYRSASVIEEALEEIEKNKDILYDYEVVEICLRLFRVKGFSF
ncbi:MAG: HD domain-containing protein [Proteobacteria bacterium]|nr:HD domain-containing protein [Pseudomonadota bacterium]